MSDDTEAAVERISVAVALRYCHEAIHDVPMARCEPCDVLYKAIRKELEAAFMAGRADRFNEPIDAVEAADRAGYVRALEAVPCTCRRNMIEAGLNGKLQHGYPACERCRLLAEAQGLDSLPIQPQVRE